MIRDLSCYTGLTVYMTEVDRRGLPSLIFGALCYSSGVHRGHPRCRGCMDLVVALHYGSKIMDFVPKIQNFLDFLVHYYSNVVHGFGCNTAL